MSFGIIVRSGEKKGSISKENKAEWRNERRVKELARRGYGVGEIQAMTHAKSGGIAAHHVEKMIKHDTKNREMTLDGNL